SVRSLFSVYRLESTFALKTVLCLAEFVGALRAAGEDQRQAAADEQKTAAAEREDHVPQRDAAERGKGRHERVIPDGDRRARLKARREVVVAGEIDQRVRRVDPVAGEAPVADRVAVLDD